MSTAFPMYLAMTAQEFTHCDVFPEHVAWMACQFSPYHKGLSNLPQSLPEDSLLILNDMTPFSDHNTEKIRDELFSTVEKLHCSGILLDFLRHPEPETVSLCRKLCQDPPCPVAVPETYWEKDMRTPVFLPAPPLLKSLKEYISSWKEESVWLEFACESQSVTITEKEAILGSLSCNPGLPVHEDKALHCAYRISVSGDHADFYLSREPKHLDALLLEAETLGIQAGIGLFQQFGHEKNPQA